MIHKIIYRCFILSLNAFYFNICRFVSTDFTKNRRVRKLYKVGIASGFGYGNLGDEAQLAFNLERWRKIVPNHQIVAFSPDPLYTSETHNVSSIQACRVELLGAGSHCGIWLFPRLLFLPLYILKYCRLSLNTHLLRAGFGTFLLSTSENRFLNNLDQLSILHISGGGFITGKTYSRLLDAILMMLLAKKFGLPYFLTGHTIGLVDGTIEKFLLKRALNGASLVTLRDNGLSRDELTRLGINDKITHNCVDDALFCSSSTLTQLPSGIASFVKDNKKSYVIINYHHWKFSEKKKTTDNVRMANIVKHLTHELDLHVVFLSMHRSDLDAINTLNLPLEKVTILPYLSDYRHVRKIIREAKFLISYKHHPLIFAMGENVPVIAVSSGEYYKRKNLGALKNHSQQEYLLEDEFTVEQMTLLISRIQSKYKEIVKDMKQHNISWRDVQAQNFRSACHSGSLVSKKTH